MSATGKRQGKTSGAFHLATAQAAERITGRRWCFSSRHYARIEHFTRSRRKCDRCLDRLAARTKPRTTTEQP